MLLPSSHVSCPAMTPSPHTVAQLAPLHLHPHCAVHAFVHPGPLVSHCSLPATRPSPHFVLHIETEDPQLELAVADSHVHPVSRRHDAEQPSPFAVLPSSHCSFPSTICPSPHNGWHLVPLQLYPHSKRHSAEQPSPDLELPSSQPFGFNSAPV